jgi:quercetin dioxygenase-like cupin family protein
VTEAAIAPAPRAPCPIDQIERALLDFPQEDIPVTHRFAPGLYWREIAVPAGVFIIGHRHKTAHFNILLKGRLRVLVDGRVKEVQAPYIVVSEPGVRKAALALEDSVWVNLHPTEETDLAKIEEAVIEKSDGYLDHQLDREAQLLLEGHPAIQEAAS